MSAHIIYYVIIGSRSSTQHLSDLCFVNASIAMKVYKAFPLPLWEGECYRFMQNPQLWQTVQDIILKKNHGQMRMKICVAHKIHGQMRMKMCVAHKIHGQMRMKICTAHKIHGQMRMISEVTTFFSFSNENVTMKVDNFFFIVK